LGLGIAIDMNNKSILKEKVFDSIENVHFEQIFLELAGNVSRLVAFCETSELRTFC
jgi:hypothetical protein